MKHLLKLNHTFFTNFCMVVIIYIQNFRKKIASKGTGRIFSMFVVEIVNNKTIVPQSIFMLEILMI